MIVDAHLDLAWNALRGRDVTRPAAEQPSRPNEIATVGLPDLRAGGVGLICGTIFIAPETYTNGDGGPDFARAKHLAIQQLLWYLEQQQAGRLRVVETVADLPTSPPGADKPLPTVLLLEGADCIHSSEDVQDLWDVGLRAVGLAWRKTRHAGGTNEPGPITPSGARLVRDLTSFGMIHDASHLAEESFWNLADLTPGPIMASHSNCARIVGEDPKAVGRHLTDRMIAEIARRDGIVGINLFDRFLLPAAEYGKRRATLDDVVRHIDHVCQVAGNAAHVGIGTDMDGGLGRDQCPEGIETSADLPKLTEALIEAGFSQDDAFDISGGNWLRFFRDYLPV
ncbi:MAG: dipeptidase [Phycisphaerae bacterium]